MQPSAYKLKMNISSFDLIKGIAMVSVIVIHMLQYYDLHRYPLSSLLYGWNNIAGGTVLPMFLCVSGYRFKSKPILRNLKKSFSELVKPYLWVTLIITLLFPFFQYINYPNLTALLIETLRQSASFLLGLSDNGTVLFGHQLYIGAVVWFLLALFIAQNILNLILKVNNEIIQIILVLVCQFLGLKLVAAGFFYFCIAKGLMCVLYCYCGYLLKKHNFFERVNVHLIGLIGLLCGLLILAPLAVHPLGLLLWTLCSCLFLPLVGAYLGRFDFAILNPIKQIGVYSYWILCIHAVEITCIPWPRWGNAMVDMPLLAFLVDGCIKIAIYTVSCNVIKKIIMNNYNKRKEKK